MADSTTNKEFVDVDDTSHEKQQEALTIQLGDIIKIISPVDERIHETVFFVNYIDENKGELLQQNGEIYLMFA